MAWIFIHHLDFKEKCPQKQPDSSFTKSLLLLELASDTSLIPNLGKFAVALWQFFLLLQDQASSGEDINWADIKQLKLILLNCAGEPHRLETKTMDTKGVWLEFCSYLLSVVRGGYFWGKTNSETLRLRGKAVKGLTTAVRVLSLGLRPTGYYLLLSFERSRGKSKSIILWEWK